MDLKGVYQLLVQRAVQELLGHKSFVLLVGLLIVLDRWLERVAPQSGSLLPSKDKVLSPELAEYVFLRLPGDLLDLVLDPKLILIAIGLFLFKQLVSLWPSSDMRRMHREERGRSGPLASLTAIRWSQVVWDAIAVGSLVLMAGLWFTLAYILAGSLWQVSHSPSSLILFGLLAGAFLPLLLAGLSYSSKIAVIGRGSLTLKLGLFSRLFRDFKLFWQSWVFFLLRCLLESLFVLCLPVIILLNLEPAWLRVTLAICLAAPVYSFLKMASFKFFLEMYKDSDLVQSEYKRYFKSLKIDTKPGSA
jgi:hypothetical protein